MSFDQIANLPLVQALGWTLLHFLWQGTLIAAAAFLVLGTFRREAAERRYTILMLAFLAMAVAPLITLNTSYRSLRQSRANNLSPLSVETQSNADDKPEVLTHGSSSQGINKTELEIANSAMHPRLESSVEANLQASKKATESTNTARRDSTASSNAKNKTNSFLLNPILVAVAAFCWLTGVFLLGIRFFFGCLFLGRQVNGVQIVPNETLVGWFQAQCCEQGIKVRVRLMESSRILVPMTIGWIRPMVVVPTSALTGLSEEELKAIIIHEIAHVRRWDYLVNLFQTLFEIVMFFHPAVWWLSKQVRIERENCCDDIAVSLSGKPKVYVNALAEIAKSSTSREFGLAPSAAGGELLSRVQRILVLSKEGRQDGTTGRKSKLSKRRLPASQSLQSVGGILSLSFAFVLVAGICVATNLFSGNANAFGSIRTTEDQTRNSEDKKTTISTAANTTSKDDLIVLGLNVSKFPASTSLKKITDLYTEDEKKPGHFIWNGKGWSIEVEQDIWLKLRVDLNRFYVHDQSHTRSVHYGPIPGNPFEKLRLTEWMIEAINSKKHSQKSHFRSRTTRMLKSTHQSLNLNGLKIAAKLKRLAYRDLLEFHDLVNELGSRVDDAKQNLRNSFKEAQLNLNQQLDEFARVQAVIRKEECESSRPATEFELAKLSWGKKNNGLRMALAPWDGEHKTFRTSTTISSGHRGQYRTLIRNVSMRPIAIGVIKTKERPRLYAIDDKTGGRIDSNPVMIGGGVLKSNIWIQPGEVAVAQTFALDFFDGERDRPKEVSGKIRWWDQIGLKNGRTYKLFAALRLPQTLSKTKDGRWLPARNLWRGILTTGPIAVEFKNELKTIEDPKSGEKPAAKDEEKNRIVDVNGNGIPDAKIEITEYTYQKTYKTFCATKSDANGYFSYPPETPDKRNFFIRVSASGYFSERWIGNHSVHIKREGKLVPDVLKLGKSVTVSGKVIGPGSKALAGIPLSVDYKTNRSARINARTLVTDKNGEFKINDLPPGKIFVRYEWRDKREDPMPRPISFGIAYANAEDGESVKELNLDFSKQLATIRGRVLDRDGKPMKNVEVVARWARVLVNLDHTVRSKTDANGNYEFKGLQPGTYLLGGGRRFPVGSSRPQVVMAGQILEHNIESFIRGRKPPADRKVELDWSKGELQYALQLEPAKKNYQLRDKIKVKLLVRNSTKNAQDFEHTFSFNRVHIGNDEGFYRSLDYRFFSGIPRVENFKLAPDHEVELGSFLFQITHPDDTGSAEATFGVNLKPGRFKISMSIGNGFDSVRLRKFPTDKDLLEIRNRYVPKKEITVIEPKRSSK